VGQRKLPPFKYDGAASTRTEPGQTFTIAKSLNLKAPVLPLRRALLGATVVPRRHREESGVHVASPPPADTPTKARRTEGPRRVVPPDLCRQWSSSPSGHQRGGATDEANVSTDGEAAPRKHFLESVSSVAITSRHGTLTCAPEQGESPAPIRWCVAH
jgi:hypothetical protein